MFSWKASILNLKCLVSELVAELVDKCKITENVDIRFFVGQSTGVQYQLSWTSGCA